MAAPFLCGCLSRLPTRCVARWPAAVPGRIRSAQCFARASEIEPVLFGSIQERRLRTGPPSCRHGGRRSRRRPCLSSRPRHIPVPLDPHGDRTASFGASRAWLRSLQRFERSGSARRMRQTTKGKSGNALSLSEDPSSIEATTPKIPKDAVSWGEGPSGTWMCHDPSKDRMSSRGMGPLPRARRPLPKPTLQPASSEADTSAASSEQRFLRQLHPKPPQRERAGQWPALSSFRRG